MRITVKDGNKPAFCVVLPTWLVFNRVTAGILSRLLEKKGVLLSGRQIILFQKTLVTYKNRHRDWILAECKSADGEEIQIEL